MSPADHNLRDNLVRNPVWAIPDSLWLDHLATCLFSDIPGKLAQAAINIVLLIEIAQLNAALILKPVPCWKGNLKGVYLYEVTIAMVWIGRIGQKREIHITILQRFQGRVCTQIGDRKVTQPASYFHGAVNIAGANG